MIVTETPIPGVLIIEPKSFRRQPRLLHGALSIRALCGERHAARSFFKTTCRVRSKARCAACIFRIRSRKASWSRFCAAAVLDVAVDVRVGSPTFGQHVMVELNDENRRQFWIPPGFAHGFMVLSDTADFFYKCDEIYSPANEHVLLLERSATGDRVGQRRIRYCRRATRIGRTLAQLDGQAAEIRAGLMRILVTGVSGQVGGALAAAPASLRHGHSARRDSLDFTKLELILAALDRDAPDLIINPAAYTAVDKAEDEPELACASTPKRRVSSRAGRPHIACR